MLLNFFQQLHRPQRVGRALSTPLTIHRQPVFQSKAIQRRLLPKHHLQRVQSVGPIAIGAQLLLQTRSGAFDLSVKLLWRHLALGQLTDQILTIEHRIQRQQVLDQVVTRQRALEHIRVLIRVDPMLLERFHASELGKQAAIIVMPKQA
ncbi:hypothetical protein D3C76_1339190 [compost metagenome]